MLLHCDVIEILTQHSSWKETNAQFSLEITSHGHHERCFLSVAAEWRTEAVSVRGAAQSIGIDRQTDGGSPPCINSAFFKLTSETPHTATSLFLVL